MLETNFLKYLENKKLSKKLLNKIQIIDTEETVILRITPNKSMDNTRIKLLYELAKEFFKNKNISLAVSKDKDLNPIITS